jgi:hypothetical protein
MIALAARPSYADSVLSGTPTEAPTAVARTVAPALRLPVTVWVTAVAADQATTYWFASRHGDVLREANPIVGRLDRHPVLLVAAGSALDATTAIAAHRFLGRRHPRIAQLVFMGAAAYRAYLAYHNVQNISYAKRFKAAQR